MNNVVHILKQTVNAKRIALSIYSLASAGFLLMYVAFYPAIQDQAKEFEKLLDAYPEGLFKAFGIEELNFETLEKFLALEQFSIVWPLMVILLMVSFAGAAIAREVETGTIELLLARSVSRLQLFFGRYFGGLAALTIFVLASTYPIIPMAELFGLEYVLDVYHPLALLCFCFGWAIWSMGLMFSAIFSERSRVYMVSGGILLLMYVAKIASSLKESLDWLQYSSFFYYFDANAVLIREETPVEALAVFAGVAVVCTAIGAGYFNKRDIAV